LDEKFFCTDEMKSLIGTYLGYATGSAKMTDDSTRFPSTAAGNVYTINGYNKDYRICILDSQGSIMIFSNLNGIMLYTGSDLYGSRLKMKGNYSSFTYSKNGVSGSYSAISGLTAADYDRFIDVLYSAPFVDVNDIKNYLYSGQKQIYINVKMKDGTTIKLQLFESGYVRYMGMDAGFMVRVSNDIFKKIFDRCI